MSKKNINQKAFEQAEKELLEKKVLEVKGFILKTLESIEAKKKAKERVEEELRILKLDLDDLRKGNFSKIEERRDKSPAARRVSVEIPNKAEYHTAGYSSILGGANNTFGIGSSIGGQYFNAGTTVATSTWENYTSGTYLLPDGTLFYL